MEISRFVGIFFGPHCRIFFKRREKSYSSAVKYVGPVGQSDISYECPTKNVRVPDQISDRK